MKKHHTRKIIIWSLGGILIFIIGLKLIYRPSQDRVWELGQEKLPHILFDKNGKITIENFRNFDWKEDETAAVNYETRTFELDALESISVVISHFSDFEGLAHIFLSFGFQTGEQIVVSLETRRESDEEFSPLLGILRQYEIIYVVASEKDVIGVRTNVRHERVYLYPTQASPEQAQDLFRLVSHEINSIYKTPRIYNTFLHNCANELTRLVEEMSNIKFPITWKTILPGYFDEILYDLKIIDTGKSFELTKKDHLIHNGLVDKNSPTFEEDLRKSLPKNRIQSE